MLSVGLAAGAGLTATAAQSPYPAASPYSVPAPLGDADQLAVQMRSLANDPTNLYLLINAAQLSLKVGDTDAAAALFTRAEKVAPDNPQVKAGMGRLLVQSERPGEALRLFQQAAAAGAAERDFGSDRALAYDLVGQQERAQRDYRAQLRLARDDETIRRYALSLGISGLKEPALALLEPLNRRGDRGAWRTRAFVLAMTGDRAGAAQIATTMMPAGMAQGLAPFFDRLPRLSPIDRAFAVHFGEIRPSATRVADARRVPALPPLSPEPNPFPPAARAPVQVAAVDTKRLSKREQRRQKNLAPPVVVLVAPLPPPPAPTAGQFAGLGANRLPPPPEAYGSGTQFASRGVTVLPPPGDAYLRRADPVPAPGPNLVGAVPPAASRTPPTRVADDGGDDGPDELVVAPPVAVATRTLTPSRPPVTSGGAGAAPSATFTQLPPAVTPSVAPATAPPTLTGQAALATFTLAPAPAAADGVIAPNAPEAIVAITPPPSEPAGVVVAAITPATGAPPPPKGETGDAVLAAIVANIQVPASELAADKPAPLGTTRLLSAVEKKADTLDARIKADAKAKAARAKAQFAREEARKPDPAKTDPARIWVQVAGGANEGDLPKEWAKAVAKAPAAFRGRTGWTTPLRATNRVLTGPFKTDAEARTFVNAVGKAGLSAFTFTSDPGQKITRLAPK